MIIANGLASSLASRGRRRAGAVRALCLAAALSACQGAVPSEAPGLVPTSGAGAPSAAPAGEGGATLGAGTSAAGASGASNSASPGTAASSGGGTGALPGPAGTSAGGASGAGSGAGGGSAEGSGAGATGGRSGLAPIVPQTTTVAALPAPEAVTLDAQGLASSVTITAVMVAPYFPDAPAAGNGTPPALRVTFDNQPVTDAYVAPRERQVLIYPAGGFHKLYKGTSMLLLAERVDRLAALLNAEPVTISTEIPLLPELGASQALAVKKKYVEFQGGRGIRFVAQYDQGLNPFTNQAIFYTYQGLTADGKYYISAFYPVRTDVLPDQYSDVSQADQDEITNNFAVYRARMHGQLNQLDDADFVPSLAKLDAMVGSLHVGQ